MTERDELKPCDEVQVLIDALREVMAHCDLNDEYGYPNAYHLHMTAKNALAAWNRRAEG